MDVVNIKWSIVPVGVEKRQMSNADASDVRSITTKHRVRPRLFAGFSRGDDADAFETKSLVANPIFAPVGHRRRIRSYSLCFAEKSAPMKS